MAETPKDAAAAAAPPAKGGGGMLPMILIIVLVPALCFGTTQFLLIPALKKAAGNAGEETASAAEEGAEHGAKAATGGHGKKAEAKKGEKKKESDSPTHSFDFTDIVVNLSGSHGTRYLRTRFTLAGSDEHIDIIAKTNETKLKDIAIGILSTQTLDSLEVPGAKAAIRNQLIEQFNSALHGDVVEELFFSEFVVQ